MYKRDYKKESRYDSQPHVKKKRANRNAARRKMMKAGLVRVGDGKDVTHRNGNPRDNRWSNLGLSSVKRNRSFARTKSAGKVNSRA